MAAKQRERRNDERLDFFSLKFEPLKALYTRDLQPPVPNIQIFNNLAEYARVIKEGKVKPKQRRDDHDKTESIPTRTRNLKPEFQPKAIEEKLKTIAENIGGNDGSVRTGSESASGQFAAEMARIQQREAVIRGKKRYANVLDKMEACSEGPFRILYTCLKEKKLIKVWTRRYKGLRGVMCGYLIAFDKHMNLAMMDVDEVYTLERRITRDPPQEENTTTVNKKKKKKKKKRNKCSLESCINEPTEEKENSSSSCCEKATKSDDSFKDVKPLNISSVDSSFRNNARDKSKVSDDSWESSRYVPLETTHHDQKKDEVFGENVLPVNVTKANQNTNESLSCTPEHVVDGVKDSAVGGDTTHRIPEIQESSGYEAKAEPNADEEFGTPATFLSDALQGGITNYFSTLHDGCARTRGSREPLEHDNNRERDQIHTIIATPTGEAGPDSCSDVESELPTEPTSDTIEDSLSILQDSCARTRGSRKSLVRQNIGSRDGSLSTTVISTCEAEPEPDLDTDNGQQVHIQSNAPQGSRLQPLPFLQGSSARTRGRRKTLLSETNTDYVVPMTLPLCEVQSSSDGEKAVAEITVEASVFSVAGFKPTEANFETITTVPLIDSATARLDYEQLDLPQGEHRLPPPVVTDNLSCPRKDGVNDPIAGKDVPVMVDMRTEDFGTVATKDSDNIQTVNNDTLAEHPNLQSSECVSVSSAREYRADGPLDTNPVCLATEEQQVVEHKLFDRGGAFTEGKGDVCSSIFIAEDNAVLVPSTEGSIREDSASQVGYTAAKSEDADFSEVEQGVAHPQHVGSQQLMKDSKYQFPLCIESNALTGDEDKKDLGDKVRASTSEMNIPRSFHVGRVKEFHQTETNVSEAVSDSVTDNIAVNTRDIRTTHQLDSACENRRKDEKGNWPITKQDEQIDTAIPTHQHQRAVTTETLLTSNEVLMENLESFSTTIGAKCSSQASIGVSEMKARCSLIQQQPSYDNDGETEPQLLERIILEDKSTTLRHTKSEIMSSKEMEEDSSSVETMASELPSLPEVAEKDSNSGNNDKLKDEKDRHETNLLPHVQHSSGAKEAQKLQLMDEANLGIIDTNRCCFQFDRPCKETLNKEVEHSTGVEFKKEHLTAAARVTHTILGDKGDVCGQHVRTNKTKTCQHSSELHPESDNRQDKTEALKTVDVMQGGVSEDVRQFVNEKERIQKADGTFSKMEIKQSRVECTEEGDSLVVRASLGSAKELPKGDTSLEGKKGNKQRQGAKNRKVTREQRNISCGKSDVGKKCDLIVSCEDSTVVRTQHTSTDTDETMEPTKKLTSINVKHKEKEAVSCSEDNVQEFVSMGDPKIKDKNLLPNKRKLEVEAEADPGIEKEEGEITSSDEEAPDTKEHSKAAEKADCQLEDNASFGTVKEMKVEEKEEGELTSSDDDKCPTKKQVIHKEPVCKAARRASGSSSSSRRKSELSKHGAGRTRKPSGGKDKDRRKGRSTAKTVGYLDSQIIPLSSKTPSKPEQRRVKTETKFAGSSGNTAKLEQRNVRRSSEGKIRKEGHDCKQGEKSGIRIRSRNDEKVVSEKAKKSQGKNPSVENVDQSQRDSKSRTDISSPKYSKDNRKTSGKSGKDKLQHSVTSSTREAGCDTHRDQLKTCSTSQRGSETSVIDNKVTSLPRKDVKHRSKVSAPDSHKLEGKSSRTRSSMDKIKGQSAVGSRISTEQSRKRREKGTERETNLRDSFKLTKRRSSTPQKSSVKHPSTSNSKPVPKETSERQDSPGRVAKKVVRPEEKYPSSSVTPAWKGKKRLTVDDQGDKRIKRRRLDDDDKRTATNRRNSQSSSCSQSSRSSRRQSPIRRGATSPTVTRASRESRDSIGSKRKVEQDNLPQTSQVKARVDSVSKDSILDKRRTSMQKARTKIPYGGSSSKGKRYSPDDKTEISARREKERRHKRDKGSDKPLQQHTPPLNESSGMDASKRVQDHGMEETKIKAGKRERSRENESKCSTIRTDTNLSRKEDPRHRGQPVDEGREKAVKTLGLVKRSETSKVQSEYAPSRTAAHKLTTVESEAKRDNRKEPVTNSQGNSTSNVTSRTERTTYVGHEKAKCNVPVSRGSSSKPGTPQRERKKFENTTKRISKAGTAAESAVSQSSKSVTDGSTKMSTRKTTTLLIKPEREDTGEQVSASAAVKPNCKKQAKETDAVVETEGLSAGGRDRRLMIGRDKYLVFRRRHVNQLFVRGDNVVMVGYA